ncbi:MAG: hypothetical protein JNM69_03255 [Archangium sp.]|nr:hypothetical protein [Archangium sp.]
MQGRSTFVVRGSAGCSVPVLDALAALECLPLKHFVFDTSCGEVVA